MCSYQIVAKLQKRKNVGPKSVGKSDEKGMKRDPHKMMTWGSQCLSNMKMTIFVHDLGRVNDTASKLARSAGKNDRGQLGLPPATAPVIDMLGPQLTLTPAENVG